MDEGQRFSSEERQLPVPPDDIKPPHISFLIDALEPYLVHSITSISLAMRKLGLCRLGTGQYTFE